MPSSDADRLRDLAERFLYYASNTILLRGTNDSQELVRLPNAQLLVGELPQDLPVDLPVPAGAELLGSVWSDYGVAGGTCSFRLVVALDAPVTVDIYAYYDETMTARGWFLPPPKTAFPFDG